MAGKDPGYLARDEKARLRPGSATEDRARASRPPLLMQQLHCERAAIPLWRGLERGDGVLGMFDRLQRVGSQITPVRTIVGVMPHLLQFDKEVGAIFNLRRESHPTGSLTVGPGVTVLQGPVEMAPGFVRTVGADPDEQVGCIFGERVEQCVVGRAYRTPQIGLARLTSAGVRQLPRRDNQARTRLRASNVWCS